MAIPHLPKTSLANEAGFTMLELMIAVVFILMIGGALAAVSKFVSMAMHQGEAKSIIVNSARNGLDNITRETRNNLILINTVPGTPIGVNFDLDDKLNGNPAVRDGLLFYFDNNQTARLVDLNGDGQIDNLGLDDLNNDGKPDVIGIGLVPQQVFNNGSQDFIDTNIDGIPDDLNGDGQIDAADRLWRLVIVNFDNIDQVTDITRWQAGHQVASNIFLRKANPNGKLDATNILTIQYLNNGEAFTPFDNNKDGLLSEIEIGNSENNNSVIDTPAEIKRIGSIQITLDMAVDFDLRRKVNFTSITSIIKPRAFEILETNDITTISDTISAGNIN